MQANVSDTVIPRRYRTSGGTDYLMGNRWSGYSSCSGWPVIKGDHKTPNNHSYSYWKSRGSGVYRHSASSGDWWEADVGAIPAFNVGSSTVAYESALSRLVDKARGGLDLTIDLAQAGQTGRMFNAHQTFVNYANNFRRGLVKGTIKSVGDAWLTYVYGWKPLIGDIYAAADESLRYIVNRYSTLKASGTFRDVDFVEMNDGTFSIGKRVPLQYEDNVTISLTIDNSTTMDLSRWGSLNPVSIGWELLPYSFVVDWFLNVGQFLRNAETALLYGSSVVDGYSSTLRVAKVSGFGGDTILSGPGYFARTSGSWSARRVSFNRIRLTTFPVPGRISLNTDLSSGKLLNAAGLLSQFLR